MILQLNSKVMLRSGYEGVVERVDLGTNIAWIRLDNSDLFPYTLDGIHITRGGQCDNIHIYDFYDGSMNVIESQNTKKI